MSERAIRISRAVTRIALVVFFAVVACAAFVPGVARAQSPAPSFGPPPVADCKIVDASDAGRILGYPVGSPDESSARGGICFFGTRAVSQEGSVTYALVTMARLRERRAFFAASARRCGGVAASAPNAALCGTYARLAAVKDLDAYFEARTAYGDATPIAKLGDRAIAAPDAVYVRRGDTVFECVVRRGESFDLARSIELARLVLERAPQP